MWLCTRPLLYTPILTEAPETVFPDIISFETPLYMQTQSINKLCRLTPLKVGLVVRNVWDLRRQRTLEALQQLPEGFGHLTK